MEKGENAQSDLVVLWTNKLIEWVKQDLVDIQINIITDIIQFKTRDTKEVFELDTTTQRLLKVTEAHGREIIETFNISDVSIILKFLLFSTKSFVYIEPLEVDILIKWVNILPFTVGDNFINFIGSKTIVNIETGKITENADDTPIGYLTTEEIVKLQQAIILGKGVEYGKSRKV